MRNMSSNKPQQFLGFSICLLGYVVGVISQNQSDGIFLNCGGPNSTDPDGRKWISDIGSSFFADSTTDSTTAAEAAAQKAGVPQIPYMNARISQSNFTYSFGVGPGRIFVRLHLYSASYNGLDASDARFSATSGAYTLLRNFSAAQTMQALNYDYMVKEFSVHVPPGEVLNITFAPSTNSYAFVNGIEVVSHPDDIYTAGTAIVVGQSTGFTIDNATVLENLYRLNVGGNSIKASDDDAGLFRSWRDDSIFLFSAATGVTGVRDPNVTVRSPRYFAPLDVYSTLRSMGPNSSVNQNFNLTWLFRVDSGFSYLVRLHFCEISSIINKVNQRAFSIFLNNRTAVQVADVIAWAGGNGAPIHRDYVVLVPTGPPQQDFWLDLHPYTASNPQRYDAILNGLEIFKINDTSGNLGGQNPIPPPPKSDPPPTKRSSSKNHEAAIGGGVGAGVAALLVAIVLVTRIVSRRRRLKDPSSSGEAASWLPLSQYRNSPSLISAGKSKTRSSHGSSLPSSLCRYFSIAEIKAATNDFDEALLLGLGGFGKVYRGEIDSGTRVAIKRGNPLAQQGEHEFQTEIEMLSKLRHRHLVSLIGFCEDKSEMILVYDYMGNGTLREHLYNSPKIGAPLSWKQRLEICIGAARGLHYLHTGAMSKHTIIHRDVKTTNILLDEKWVAKVSDFGLSKTNLNIDGTHVSTVVKGSFGYLDPEYYRRQQLTEKSDVYSFGVVLFEVLCARPALNRKLPKEQVSLAEWAEECYNKGILHGIMDPYLVGKIAAESFNKFADTAAKCVADVGTQRPSMGDVLWNLEFALQLQESADVDVVDADVHSSKTSGFSTSLTTVDSDGGLTPTAIFSQIMNPHGR